jgi:hypothetical protein
MLTQSDSYIPKKWLVLSCVGHTLTNAYSPKRLRWCLGTSYVDQDQAADPDFLERFTAAATHVSLGEGEPNTRIEDYRTSPQQANELRHGGLLAAGDPTQRVTSIGCALKLILEPIEADFQPRSYCYRPRKSAHRTTR